jgi:hypothetical protein
MAIITAYDALGRGINNKTGNFSVEPSSDTPVGEPLIEVYDYDTVLFAQFYTSQSGDYIISAYVTDYSFSEYRIDSLFIFDKDANLQTSFENVNIFYNKNEDFSQGAIFTNLLSSNDQIYGNSFSDYIKGGDGDDYIFGNA